MYESKLTTVVMCVCVSFQFFFATTTTRAHNWEPTGKSDGVTDFRLNQKFTRKRIGTSAMRGGGGRYVPPKSHQERAANTKANSPTRKQKPHLPKYMVDLYESAKEADDSVNEVELPWTETILQMENIKPLIKGILPKQQIHIQFLWEYRFNWSSIPEEIPETEFVLTLRRHRHRHCHFRDLRLHTSSSHLSLPKIRLKANNLVMNVTDLLKKARKLQTEDFTLRIISSRVHRQPCLSNTDILLVMYTGITIDSLQKANIHRKHQLSRTFVGRGRRSVDNTSSLQTTTASTTTTTTTERDNHTVRNVTTCHKKPWSLIFSEIQLNWIHYPTNYTLNYCSGRCVGLLDSRISNHAFLRNRYHIATRYRNKSIIPFPCCIPTSLAPLKVLYTDRKTNILVIGNIPNMIVQKCSCR